ncbi:MAG TPA: pyrroloquinoline quinone biosynthesis protein PqqB [Acidisphaera sp.]|nr:pyrroloquinoline quinone biosynthesis protein PqqB [Acidisphaera sp.]
MRAVVLGSAAGGGFPQWNCACAGCRRARANDPAALHRTQTSLAVSADGHAWVILNAAPDLPAQIAANRFLQPGPDARGRASPIAAVVLTSGEVDTVAGLLSLREGQPFVVHGAASTLAILDDNPIFRVLPASRVPRYAHDGDRTVALATAAGEKLGLEMELFAVPGKVPLFNETEQDPFRADEAGTVGVRIAEPGGPSLFFVPGCARVTPELRRRLDSAALLLFDGTLWHDEEMIAAGLGQKTGARMGHMSISGPGGTIAALRDVAVGRRVFIHINNTNPVLLTDSPEYAEAVAAGWTVARDGMEFSL